MGRSTAPPREVNLIYRTVGKTHVFTALELTGFHVGSSRLSHAFNQAMIGLNEHVSRLYRCDAKYHFDLTFEEFSRKIGADGAESFTARREDAPNYATAH